MSHDVECLMLPVSIDFYLFSNALKFIAYFYDAREGIRDSHMLSKPFTSPSLGFFSPITVKNMKLP